MVLVHSFRRKKSSRNNDVMVSVGVARFTAILSPSGADTVYTLVCYALRARTREKGVVAEAMIMQKW
jgi:hypothetical protein